MLLATPSVFTSILRAGLNACMPNGGSKMRLTHSSNQIKCFSLLAASLRASLVYLPNTHGCCSLSFIEIDLLGVAFLDTVGDRPLVSLCSGGCSARERSAIGAVLGAARRDARRVPNRSGGVRGPAAAERARAAVLRQDGQDGQHHRTPLGALPECLLHVFTGFPLQPRSPHLWQKAMTCCLSSAHRHPVP
jgi:hypothetical protein